MPISVSRLESYKADLFSERDRDGGKSNSRVIDMQTKIMSPGGANGEETLMGITGGEMRDSCHPPFLRRHGAIIPASLNWSCDVTHHPSVIRFCVSSTPDDVDDLTLLPCLPPSVPHVRLPPSPLSGRT
ncbi:hypothetical protein DPEC_G00164970 [Dallia pectoralis]|uniref:Uncharacterized protein n=1 Tax=Dallia pectoralis TaxID=75939 RepID=A0ACC2GH09_DALPE|nr:hypothetical protein DPEC_G00164970 [Dallia pectoralis]